MAGLTPARAMLLAQLLSWAGPGVRLGPWVKPFASFKPNVNPAYCWEGVIWKGGRPRDRYDATVRDFLSENITLQRGLTGAKPDAFWHWIFDLLNIQPDDDFDDLYPGTGGGGRNFLKRRMQPELASFFG